MLRLTLVDSLLPPHGRREVVTARGDMTGRELARLYQRETWHGSPVVLSHLGRVLEGEELDRELLWGDVLLAPAVLGFSFKSDVYRPLERGFKAFQKALGLRELYRVTAKLAEAAIEAITPDPPDRGDDTSPTYSWTGIASTYGLGFRIPIGYGEHDLGGQVTAADVSVGELGTQTTGDREVLNVQLALAQGPIESVGGVNADSDGLGDLWDDPRQPIPNDIRVNGVRLLGRGAEAAVRLGATYQAPMLGFERSRSTLDVGAPLERRDEQVVSVVPVPEANRLSVRLEFPAGLYKEAGGGRTAETVEFWLDWRPRSSLQGLFWSLPQRVVVSPPTPRSTRFSHWFSFPVTPNGVPDFDGYEVRVRRITEAGDVRDRGGEVISDAAVLREIVAHVDYLFAHPGVAMLGLRIVANDRLQGGQPQYQIRARLRRVRVFEAAVSPEPSADRYWTPPANPDPYSGIWSHPPGRNPAWIAADMLTNEEALGSLGLVPDWLAFRDWADFCDQDDGAGGPLFACDLVHDRGEDPFAALMRVFRAGRAVWVIYGRRVVPVYDYRDAHGRGSNVVPAKQRTTIVCSSNLSDFEVEYLNPRRRPDILQATSLFASLDFEQDTIPIEDPAAPWNDPGRVRQVPISEGSIDFHGVTREEQIERECLLIHAQNRLVRKRVKFRAGPEQLVAEVGDLIGVQHDAFRPWGDRSTYFSCRIKQDTTGTRSIVLDRDLEVTGGAHSVVVQVIAPAADAPAPISGWVVAEGDGKYPAGTLIATSAAQDPVRVVPGSVAVVGEWSGDAGGVGTAFGVEDYQVTRKEIAGDETVAFEAEQWVPEVYDAAEPDGGLGGALATIDDEVDPVTVFEPPADIGAPIVPGTVSEVRLQAGQRRGQFVVRWTMPENHRGLPARVFVEGGDGAPDLVGQSASGELALEGLDPTRLYRFRVVPQDQQRQFADPREAPAWELEPPEWRPSAATNVAGVAASDVAEGVLLRWDAIRNEELDGYSVRLGQVWSGARELVSGPETEAVINELVPGLVHRLMIRGRFRGGCDSTEPAVVSVTPAVPSGFEVLASAERLVAALGGYSSARVQWSAAEGLTLAASELDGEWLDAPIELVASVNAQWRVQVEVEVVDDFDLEHDDRELGDPEESFADVAGREPSARFSGDDFLELDPDGAVGDDEDPIYGATGVFGDYGRARLEVAWKQDDDSWTSWEPWKGVQQRRAKGLRVALRLERTSEDYTVRVRRVSAAALV